MNTKNEALAKHEPVPSYIVEATERYGAERMRLLRDTLARDLTMPELGLFTEVCKRTGLDPFARQIYAVKRWDKKLGREVMNIQTGIDGFRAIAERTGRYVGQRGPFWCGDDGVWRDVWLDKKPPRAAKVEVLRADFRESLVGVALWSEYAQTFPDGNPMAMWGKLPSVMLAKCAESIALRRAFPQELSGIYTSDEMSQADKDDKPPSFVDTTEQPKSKIDAYKERHREPIDVTPSAVVAREPEHVDVSDEPTYHPDEEEEPARPTRAVEEKKPPTAENPKRTTQPSDLDSSADRSSAATSTTSATSTSTGSEREPGSDDDKDETMHDAVHAMKEAKTVPEMSEVVRKFSPLLSDEDVLALRMYGRSKFNEQRGLDAEAGMSAKEKAAKARAAAFI